MPHSRGHQIRKVCKADTKNTLSDNDSVAGQGRAGPGHLLLLGSASNFVSYRVSKAQDQQTCLQYKTSTDLNLVRLPFWKWSQEVQAGLQIVSTPK